MVPAEPVAFGISPAIPEAKGVVPPFPGVRPVFHAAGYNDHHPVKSPIDDHATMSSAMIRIDKWLWAARFFKTRTLATTAVDGGKVRLNGERVKPSRPVRLGDTLDIDNGATEWQIVVAGLSDVRSAASIAQTLYAETEASLAKREKAAEQRKYFREPGADIKGRPTKRDRRQLIKTQS